MWYNDDKNPTHFTGKHRRLERDGQYLPLSGKGGRRLPLVRMSVILTCSSLEDCVRQAQENMGTALPVCVLDKRYHVEPRDMREQILAALGDLSRSHDTVLVSMGFCGGSWDQVTAPCRIVIPRVDDCVSLLLQRGDDYSPNLKQMGHLYLYEKDLRESLFSRIGEDMDEETADELIEMYFGNYHYLDIIDTGYNDCYSEAYVEAAQAEADRIDMMLDYVPGGIHLLEKLVSGDWDDQFLVAEKGHLIRHADFFE